MKKCSIYIIRYTFLVIVFSVATCFLATAKEQIKLATIDKDSIKTLKATALVNDTPKAKIGIRFFARRFFGNLPLAGLQKTDENGEASVDFPNGLPGDTLGNVTLIAQLDDDEDVTAQIIAPWGKKVKYDTEKSQRAMWASRSNAPTYLIIVSNGIILAIWGTMGYIAYLLMFRIKKLGIENK